MSSAHRTSWPASFAALLLSVALIAGCSGGGSSPSASVDDNPDVAAQDDTDAGSGGGSSGASDFEGDPRGTIEVDGVSYDLTLTAPDPARATPQCTVGDRQAFTNGMVTPDGGEIIVAGLEAWGVTVDLGDVGSWEAASNDPEIDSDVSRTLEPGRAVFEGTFAPSYPDVQPAEIRIELLCPLPAN